MSTKNDVPDAADAPLPSRAAFIDGTIAGPVDQALAEVQQQVLQVLAIVQITAHAMRENVYPQVAADAFDTLNAAVGLLQRIADRLESPSTLLDGVQL